MRIYNVKTIVKEYKSATEQIKEATIILAEHDDVAEFIQMMYGTWFDVVSFKIEKANIIHISKNYIAQEAMQMIRFN